MMQGFVRVQVMNVLPSGQKQVAIMATGADGIRFYTDDKSIVPATIDLSIDGSTEDVKVLRYLLQAKQERKLLVLPCPMGSTIYMIVKKWSRKQHRTLFFIKTSELKESNLFRVLREFNKTIFRYREIAQYNMEKMEAAENALRSGKAHCDNCEFGQDSDRRCMCEKSQWLGRVTPQDNYCGQWWPRENMV